MTLPRLEDVEEFPDDIWITERDRAREYRAMQREKLRNSALGRFWRRLRGEDVVAAKPQRDA